jgi:predicted RNase H-like HicB family nuclease
MTATPQHPNLRRGRGRQYTVSYQKEEEGGYSARCLELPAAISQGETLEELERNIKEAILLVLEYIESKKKQDNVITLELPA